MKRIIYGQCCLSMGKMIFLNNEDMKRTNLFKTVFENSTLGKKIITADLKIRQINFALVHMLGYDNKQELIGRNLRDFTHPDFLAQWDILRKNLWSEKNSSFSVEICMIRRDGAALWCHITSILFPDGDEILGYTIVQDINTRIKLEQEAKRLKDAQEGIIYTVAHDLKNPVLIIQSLTNLLQNEMLSLAEKDVKAYKKNKSLTVMIDEALTKMLTIIHDLLMVGELEEGIAEKERTELREFIASSLKTWKIRAQEKEVQILFHADKDTYVSINRQRMSRVMDNLLSNAIKFSHRGGEIELILKHHFNKGRLLIKDNGVGIPEPLLETVFDKFTRAHRRGTSGESTTGLGLYIAKRIVDLHEGKIWVESEHNRGSTFNIELPLESNFST